MDCQDKSKIDITLKGTDVKLYFICYRLIEKMETFNFYKL